MPRRHLVITTVATLLTVSAIAAMLINRTTLVRRFSERTVDTTYDFLLIVVLGGVVGIAFQAVAFARDRRERHREIQRNIHAALVTAYNAAKHARRNLRANGVRRTSQWRWVIQRDVVAAEYDRQLQAISQAQLQVEFAIRQVKLNERTIVGAVELKGALKDIEAYLNNLVDEWEDNSWRLASLATYPIRRLPALNEFVLPYSKTSPFKQRFKDPFKRALDVIEASVNDA